MGDVRSPQGSVLVTFQALTGGVEASQGTLLATYNLPTENLRTTYGDVTVAYQRPTRIDVSQSDVLAVVRGRISNPKLKAWTFDLDGHEFYVLRLGDGKTLLYDVSTEQWSWWSTGDYDYWRANIGLNWTQNGAVAFEYGSNVVVGDDTTGILWVLNPEQGFDDPLEAVQRDNGVVRSFPRVATGQIMTRGRVTIPCYQVYLVSDTGEPAYTGASVTLSYSDDGGKSFVNASTPIVAEAGNYYQEFVWRSVGLIRSPGRLFRVSDDGAFAQIDELTVYDDPTA